MHTCAISVHMDRSRYTATPQLTETLARRERSRNWLAKKIGVSSSLMYFLVKGERTISAEKAMRAAAVLNEPVEYLFQCTSVADLAIGVAA